MLTGRAQHRVNIVKR